MMPEIRLLPVLQIQRELYNLPRGPKRFFKYLETIRGGTDDLVLPLTAFNPMGKFWVADSLDALFAINAEAIASDAIAEANRRLGETKSPFDVALVLADDRGGGWTDRYYTEIDNRFRSRGMLKRGWAVVLFWTSETPSTETILREVLATIYRNWFISIHGEPRSLREMMTQEGLASIFAGKNSPSFDAEELAYIAEVIHPHLDATDMTVILPSLYGDHAARSVGNSPLGLSERAGFELALFDALVSHSSPEEAVRSPVSIPQFDHRSRPDLKA